MTILVTGATGFIGGRIANHLVHKATVIANGRSENKASHLNNNIQYIQGSLNDAELCSKITKGVDVIIHCAGKAGTWGNYESYYEANVVATRNLLERAQANGVKRFINISSPSIYFNYQDQLNTQETFLPKKFSNAYAKTKFLGEKLVQSCHSRHFQTLSLRPRLVIGAGDNNVLPRLIRLQKDGKLKQIGSGKNVVTVTSIKNLIQAIDLCLLAPEEAMGTVYNIGNEPPEVFWDLVNNVLQEFEIPKVSSQISYTIVSILAQLNFFKAKLFNQKTEPSLLPVPMAVLAKSMTLDLSKAKKQLGYQPEHTTIDAIKEFAIWWKEKSSNENI